MGRLQIIEKQLAAINDMVFQELCDGFILRRYPDYATFSRVGSQSGKQKSRKGTPDSLLLLHSGHYICLEYSTNVSRGVKKLAEDIEKCLNAEFVKIPVEKITEIVVVFNFNIINEDIEKLKGLVEHLDIRLTLYNLDALSLELHLNHRDLAHRYLDIPIDTGQLISSDRFVKEYNKANHSIATPLNNPFLHREEELALLTQVVGRENLVILCGPAGVGKTKLALEAIAVFQASNPGYASFCLSYKHVTLFDDLQTHLDKSGNYILFVDDANRIDAFGQVLGFLKELRTGALKVVMTVRDYALADLRKMCLGFSTCEVNIEKLADDQIKDIIKGKPWNISNPAYLDNIAEIADGNPRLAIMAAQLALAHKDITVLHDVSSLFENYFSTFVKDKDELSGVVNTKVLGLIALFYALPYKDRALLTPMLALFELTYDEFADSIEYLDRLEAVEIQFDHVKIPEQNLATFFFYRAFIDTEILSPSLLVEHFYESKRERLKECIVAANNTFGAQKVMDRLRPVLKGQLQKLELQGKPVMPFFKDYWFYLKIETLEYLYSELNLSENAPRQVYKLTYETNEFAYEKDTVLELLSNFFHHPDTYLKQAIELSFIYVFKRPDKLSELIYTIREHLSVDLEDLYSNYYRQGELFDFLIAGLQGGDEITSLAFYELSGSFLQHSFDQHRGGRKLTIQFYRVPLPNNATTRNFRKRIWDAALQYFSFFPEQGFEMLKSCGQRSFHTNKALLSFDLDYVAQLIDQHLDPNNFRHCKYVQDQLRSLRRKKIGTLETARLKKRFTNPIYKMFLLLDWDYFRGREDYGNIDHDKFNIRKEQEIRSAYCFKDKRAVEDFHTSYLELTRYRPVKNYHYGSSLDIIVDENLKNDFQLGIILIRCILENRNVLGYQPWLAFGNHLETREKAHQLWDVIASYEYPDKDVWEMNFYERQKADPFEGKRNGYILRTISESQRQLTIHLENLIKDTNDTSFTRELLHLILIKNREEGCRLYLWMNTFSSFFDYLGDDLELIKATYLQQDEIQSHFDYNCSGLKNILLRDQNFLKDYVDSLYSDERGQYNGRGEDLSLVWSLPVSHQVLASIFNTITTKDPFIRLSEHFCNVFFKKIKEPEEREAAITFILAYARDNYQDKRRMNIAVDVARHSLREVFERLVHQHVTLSQDAELFSSIRWRGNGGGFVAGDVIFGDIEAAEWRNIQALVNKLNLGLKLLPINKLLNQRIESAIASADWERQRMFTKPI
ncbi:hypothetical protein ACLI1A_12530 [Flavobacterium sp. RHBU_3]|uniref:nSTAND3 domain-containing NTPase n=1 Tax=Flavobacterium sp. RHBU_3 TaxID=3391184 RepID=UPI003984E67B